MKSEDGNFILTRIARLPKGKGRRTEAASEASSYFTMEYQLTQKWFKFCLSLQNLCIYQKKVFKVCPQIEVFLNVGVANALMRQMLLRDNFLMNTKFVLRVLKIWFS